MYSKNENIDSEIYYGLAKDEQQDDLIDFINYVFGFDAADGGFYGILPKLYNKEYHPCENNYVVIENDRFKAAIGAYSEDLSVCGTILKRRGIGNVAVHPFSRSKGYMKKLMNMAIEDMINDGIDISDLGGRRHRYGWFSYEKAGVAMNFSINGHNLRYCFSDTPKKEIELRPVEKNDSDILDKICALQEKEPLHMIRERERFYDIAVSWRNKITAFFIDGEFVGYTIYNGNSLKELSLTDESLFIDIIRNFMEKNNLWDLHIEIPLCFPNRIAQMYPIAESWHPDNGEMYTIFNFKRVVGAFMKLKSTYTTLADGELNVLIHGIAKDENIKISVKNNEVTLTDFSGNPDIELEHKRAVSFFFGIYSPDLCDLPANIKSWFPLPLYLYSSDHV